MNDVEVPRRWVVHGLDLLCRALVTLVEDRGLPEDVRHLARVAKGWDELGQFENVEQMAHLAQALLLTGDLERASERLDDGKEHFGYHQLLHITLYELLLAADRPQDAAMIALEGTKNNSGNLESFWAINGAIAWALADLPEFTIRMLKYVPKELDMGVILALLSLARLGGPPQPESWQRLRPNLFRPATPRKARLAIELAWHYGERDLCQRYAKHILEEPLLSLPIHGPQRAFFEAIAAGRKPKPQPRMQ